MWLIRARRSLPLPLPLEPAAAELMIAVSAAAAPKASRRRPPSRCKTCVISPLFPVGYRSRGDDIALTTAAGGVLSNARFSVALADPTVHVSALTKIFRVPEREAGLSA